jgi:hypothetical protein
MVVGVNDVVHAYGEQLAVIFLRATVIAEAGSQRIRRQVE